MDRVASSCSRRRASPRRHDDVDEVTTAANLAASVRYAPAQLVDSLGESTVKVTLASFQRSNPASEGRASLRIRWRVPAEFAHANAVISASLAIL
jgi:hypothetical protein